MPFDKGVAARGCEVQGKGFKEIHLKRKSCLKSLATVTKSVSVRDGVNPNQLLHRMVCKLKTEAQLKDIFKYEMCTYPPSLVNESGSMRISSKSR